MSGRTPIDQRARNSEGKRTDEAVPSTRANQYGSEQDCQRRHLQINEFDLLIQHSLGKLHQKVHACMSVLWEFLRPAIMGIQIL